MAFIKKFETKNVVEAMELADHNYTVEMEPVYLADGTKILDKKAVRRRDTGEYLGTVGKDYQLVQPVAIYEMAQALIEATGGVINAGINLHGGSVFGVSLHLARREYVAGDLVDLDFLILAAHNGMYGILGRALSRRFACTNQLPSSTKLFNLKHTRFVVNRLDTAMKMLKYYNQEIAQFDSHMRTLTNLKMTEELMVDWFRSLFPVPREDSKRSNSILENNTATFINLLQQGRGTDIPGLKGTGWHALNGLTEYVNHERTTRIKGDRDKLEVRFESINFGDGNTLMQRGVVGLLELARTEPTVPIMVR